MRLDDLIASLTAPIEAIAAELDAATPEERLTASRRLDRDAQRRLYEKASRAEPLTLEHFVPAACADRAQVIHAGRNTLPLPEPLRSFEKRFCRPAATKARLFGYNEGRTRSLIGPGYFVAYLTAGQLVWETRGSVVIDYFQIPDSEVVPGWPRVISNQQRLQRFVFAGTRDFMRKVSQHVSIGAAYKGEKPLDHYFVLCRRD